MYKKYKMYATRVQNEFTTLERMVRLIEVTMLDDFDVWKFTIEQCQFTKFKCPIKMLITIDHASFPFECPKIDIICSPLLVEVEYRVLDTLQKEWNPCMTLAKMIERFIADVDAEYA